MEFKKIRQEVIKHYEERFNKYLEKVKTEEGLNHIVRFSLNRKSYKGSFEEQQKKALKQLKNKIEKAKEKDLNFIKAIEEAENFKHLVLSVEWKNSQMWGKNPKVYTDKGFIGSSISGCGYCKLSTATAEGLNSHKPLLKELFKVEEKRLKENPNKERRDVLNYGLTSGILPLFAGGVGIESHRGVIEALGLKWERGLNTPNTDVFIISR